ncbi:MFS transporter [Aneurinibacillus uraniidurans]|uniref:MFS transporter n=1 Tax=Aneurinibacillus uraniidurans TaxID=2966586 RepID=UPI00234B226E|nr:MFS transporter [Aneurinibacillus sp. B1]WCN39714.1 MFS transporter [Aneurinibacillus sp. B1]
MATAFVTMLVAAGIRSVPGVVMVPLEQEFGWERSSISLAVAINLILYGVSGPFVAALMERFGVKKMMLGALVLLAGGTGLTTFVTSVWQLQLLWGIIIGLGSGVILTVLSATIANRWFVKHKGLVIGLLMASTATGQLAFLPLLAYLVSSSTWRTAMWTVAGAGMIMIPVVALLMKDSPADKGLTAYGAEEDDIPQTRSKVNPIQAAFAGLVLGIRSPDFWLLSGSFFICGLSTAGLVATHLIPACISYGIPEVQAASLLAFMGLFDIIGTTVSGWLSDRYNNRWLLFWYYGLRGLSLLILPYALASGSYSLLLVFAIFYGLDWIATVPPTVRLTADIFGTQNSGIVYGWIFAAHQLGSGAAAYGGGVLFTRMQSYEVTFLLAGFFCLAGALLVLRIGKKRPLSTDTSTHVTLHQDA